MIPPMYVLYLSNGLTRQLVISTDDIVQIGNIIKHAHYISRCIRMDAFEVDGGLYVPMIGRYFIVKFSGTFSQLTDEPIYESYHIDNLERIPE